MTTTVSFRAISALGVILAFSTAGFGAPPRPIHESGLRDFLLATQPELVRGDVLLTPDQLRNGIIGDRYRWPNGVIIYQLDPAFTDNERAIIQASMNDIINKSCVRFQERMSQADYVYITRGAPGTGCWSYVGRIGGRQALNLEAPGCISARGPGPHELMHAVGFEHEHSREDRDNYVQIYWENIDPPLWYAFDKVPGLTFGFPYDYLSVMQYPRKAFSINGLDTMAPYPDPDVPFGPYDYLSFDDGRKINAMYQNLCP